MSTELAGLVARLEKAVTRLEGLGAGAGAASSGSSGAASGPSAAFVEAYENDVLGAGNYKTFFDLSNELGGDIKTQADKAKAGFDAQFAIIKLAAKSKEPSQAELPNVMKAVAEAVGSAGEFREANRKSKEFNQISAISEGLPALSWVAVKPKPAPFVEEMINAAQFYSNRVLKDFKDSAPKQAEWAKAWIATLKDLQAYVKKYHTTGLTWNASGSEAKAPAPVAAAAGSGSGAPAPPPPLSAETLAAAAAAATPAASSSSSAPKGLGAALFGELNKGDGVTAGLKKVDKSQMTHKNPALRATSVVPASSAPAPAASTSAARGNAAPLGPPKLELDSKKWVVENHVGNNSIVIEDTNPKQTVYVYKCSQSTITIKGKVNNISVDSCKKCAFVFDTAVSSFETVNCQSIQVQVLGKVPTVSVDKTDGIQIYLSKDSLETEIVSSKSSEMNVSVPVEGEIDLREFPLPEQLKTVWDPKTKKVVSTILEHSG